MSDVKIFKYKSNLARKMAVPGGRSVEAALAAADGALETHRDAAMGLLDRNLSDLEALCAERAEGRVYEIAGALLDLAGFFDLGAFHRAVFSLCEISDHMGTTGRWDWPSIDVHVRALRAILADDCRDTTGAAAVLEGLAAIRERALAA